MHTGAGGIIEGDRELLARADAPARIGPLYVPQLSANMGAANVAIHLGVTGPVTAGVGACAAGAIGIAEGYHLLRRGEVDVVLAGATDAALTAPLVASLSNAGALSTASGDPATISRPFDLHRTGFVPSEGAAMMVLEPLDRARERGATVYCEIAGAAVGSDAFHITSPEPTGAGAERAMRQALLNSGIEAADIDCIVAHGTGTKLNDAAEAAAILRVFGGRSVPVTAPKSVVGHTLGAAGAFSVAVGALAVRHGLIPPGINYDTPDPDCPLDIVHGAPRQVPVRRHAHQRLRLRRPERRRRAARRPVMAFPVVVLAELDERAREALGNRAEGLRDDATAAVLPVLERIRRGGDAAVLEFLRDVDGVELTADQLIVDEGTIAAAAASVPADLVGAMAHTARNLERYHRAQLIEEYAIEVEPGVTVGERFPAVRAAGCYVPFGTAIYPSSALMLTTPARVAGVERIVLASGVDPATGEIPAAVIAAAALGGATEIWRLSGTAAVAAWAYGTETLRARRRHRRPGRALRRRGEGSRPPSCRRRLRGRPERGARARARRLRSRSGRGRPDLGGRARRHLLRSRGHHRPRTAPRGWPTRLDARLAALPAERRDAVLTQAAEGRSAIVLVPDNDAAIAFCEQVAPEHVIVHAGDADAVARQLRCAGTVCIGAFTPSPAGLLRGRHEPRAARRAARRATPRACRSTHFTRRQSFERITRDGLERLRPSIEAWATYEGLPGHLAAIDARLRPV